MKIWANKGDSARSVFQEVTYQTSTGQQYTKARIKPIQQLDPTEDTTTPAAPTEVERPPSSHLRSKTKQQSTAKEQGQPECNPAQTEVNTVEVAPKHYSLVQWIKTLMGQESL